MQGPDATLDKRALRAQIRAVRAAMTAAQRGAAENSLANAVHAALLSHVASHVVGSTVAAYASYGTEPGTAELRARLQQAGVTVLLPLVRGDDLHWAPDDDAPLRSGEFGVPEPAGPICARSAVEFAQLGPVAIIIPALAIDLRGVRLGQGRGFYDQLLAAVPRPPDGPLRIGVVYDGEVLDHIPAAPHDLAATVDLIVTPTTLIQVQASAGQSLPRLPLPG